MKIYINLCLAMFGALFATGVYAKTCTVPTYAISYDCGEGTVSGTLPSNMTVTYGQQIDVNSENSVVSGKINLLNNVMCTPPEGKTRAGHEIWVGDTLIGGGPTLLKPFKYYFQSDITIRPHYVGPDDGETLLWSSRDIDLTGTWTGQANVRWGIVIPGYGYLQGLASCGLPSLNTANGNYTGYIIDDDSVIVSYGSWCYCKLELPHFAKSKWVVQNTATCANCVQTCRDTFQSSAIFRTSVLSGARPANLDSD